MRPGATGPTRLLAGLTLVAALLSPGASAATAPGSTDVESSLSTQELLDRAGHDAVPFSPELAAVSCPIERGPLKEGSDADRLKVSTTVSATSIYYLRGRPKPTSYPTNNRIYPYEDRTWQITSVYLTQYKLEADGDLHLVLADSSGRTLVAEMPYGSCVPTSSRWKTAIATARTTFTRSYSPTTSWKYTHRLINITGLGFFDVPHGQTGAAPSGIELHPVTGITLR
jgi:hypothetical protein